MTALQKVFLLFTLMYLLCKVVLGFILFLITKKVEAKALEQKKRREKVLRVRRAKNLELYHQQYSQAEERKRNLRAL